MLNGSASVSEYRERIDRCLAFVRDRLADELRLEDLADAACFSKYHFHRVFTALVGETPAEYVKRLRLERAANLVGTQPSLSLTDVARECGFSTSSAFSRDFSAAYGVSPKRYRATVLSTGIYAPPRGLARRETETIPPELERALRESVDVKPLGPFTFAQIMHTGGYGPGIGMVWGKLMAWASKLERPDGRDPLMAGLPWDNPDITPANKCRYSACVEVPPGTPVSGPVSILEVPKRFCLSVRFTGPESRLSVAYRFLYRDILPASGMEPDDAPALEFNLAPPTRGRDPVFDQRIAVPVKEL